MNTVELLKKTINAYENSLELKKLVQHIKEVESSTIKLKEEMHFLLPQQAQVPEILGLVTSVLENVELEVKQLLHKHKEIEMTILTEQFVAPIMEYLQKVLPYPTRVQINYVEKDTEIQIEVAQPEGTKTLTLVPDFKEQRVLFVANSELCNLSPLGSLKNSFGHELLVAPAELGTLIRLLDLE
ncbi:MAG: hypothetical protein U0L26_12465 [Cellulosilyticum sp.]|nr:hypothetical protein [Cellulosilyticum sp.]